MWQSQVENEGGVIDIQTAICGSEIYCAQSFIKGHVQKMWDDSIKHSRDITRYSN